MNNRILQSNRILFESIQLILSESMGLSFMENDRTFVRNFTAMIQRIQTVFLFIAAIAMVLILFFPLWQKVNEDRTEVATMDAFELKYQQIGPNDELEVMATKDTFYIAIVAIISALIAVYSVFQYNNRLRQIQLGALNAFLIMCVMFLSLYFILKSEAALAPNLQGTYLIGFYFPVVALLCNLLANRFIRRDEQLVRSADRIR